MTHSQGNIKGAVTQAEPEWLDPDKTVEKTCRLVEEAAANGAKLVTFPECWIPGYPAWIWYAYLGSLLPTTNLLTSTNPGPVPLISNYLQNTSRTS